MRIRKFVPALALAGALLAGALPGGTAKAVNTPFSSGFQVQNLGTAGATISMTFYPEGTGAASAPIPGTIPANGQVAFATLPSGVAAGFRGSAVISSDQRIAAIVNLVSPTLNGLLANQAGALGGSYIGVTGGSRNVGLPLLFKGSATLPFNTFFNVQNVGQTQTQVTVTYSNGTTQQATIDPGKAARFDQDTNTQLPAGFVGSARITSTASDIAAVVTQVGPSTTLVYNGFGTNAQSTNPVFPLVNANNAGYFTGIAVQNVGTQATNVTVTYNREGGTCAETLNIPAGQSRNFAVDAFAKTVAGENCPNGTPAAGPAFVGSGRVTANSANQPLVAIVNQLNTTANKGGAYSGFSPAAATSTVVYPLIQDRLAGFFTGISMINAGDVATTIECTFSNTSVKETSGTIQPGGVFAVVNNNRLANGYNGSAVCRALAANAKIVGISNQLRGTSSVDAFFVYEGTNSQ